MKYRIIGTIVVIVILIILAILGVGNSGSNVSVDDQQYIEQNQ